MKYRIDNIVLMLLVALVGVRAAGFIVESPGWFWGLFGLNILLSMVSWTAWHNHLHLPVFTHPWGNAVLDAWFMVLTGSLKSSLIAIHLVSHHDDPNSPDDMTSLYHLRRLRSPGLNLLSYPFRIIPVLIRAKRQFMRANPALRRRQRRESLLVIALYIATCFVHWKAALCFMIIPVLTMQYFLLFTNFLQHDINPTDSYNHTLNITGRLYNGMFFNLGYHIAHHHFPRAHWSELPDRFCELLPHIKPEHNYRGFWQLIWQKYIRQNTASV